MSNRILWFTVVSCQLSAISSQKLPATSDEVGNFAYLLQTEIGKKRKISISSVDNLQAV